MSPPANMVFKTLPAGPPRMRPAMEKNEGDGIRGQTDSTNKYKSAIGLNKELHEMKDFCLHGIKKSKKRNMEMPVNKVIGR